MTIAVIEIRINRCLCVIHTLVVATVDDSSRHTAKDRLDHVEELRAGRERRGFNQRAASHRDHLIVLLDPLE